MSKKRFYLLLNVLCGLCLTVTACSFRKDRSSKTTRAVEQQVVSLKEKVSSLSTKQIIEELENIDDKEVAEGNYLDFAIREKRTDLVRYLLEDRQISPFSVSSQSVDLLKDNAPLKEFIESYQNPIIYGLIDIEINESPKDWSSVLTKLDIRSASCSIVISKVMDIYFNALSKMAKPVFKKPSQENVVKIFNGMKNTNVCSDMVKNIGSESFTVWAKAELLNQYYNEFESSALWELFNSAGMIQKFSVEINDKNGRLRIDPRLVILSAFPTLSNLPKKQFWMSLISPYIEVESDAYNIPYLSQSDITEKCWYNDPFCEERYENTPAIGEVYRLLHHADRDFDDPSFAEFKDDYGPPDKIGGGK